MSDSNIGKGARIVALVRDLMFGARVRSAAPGAVVAQRPEPVLEAVGRATMLVLVELEVPGSVELIEGVRARAPDARVVGFAPHVREELLASARDAGAEVLPRGAFVKRLQELVASASG